MAPLFWMFPWLPLVLTAVSELPMPVNVTLVPGQVSLVLRWDPGPRTPAEAHYRVSITTERGQGVKLVAGCQHVQHPLVCDLTETFNEPMQTYFTMVRAQLGEQASPAAYAPRYKPVDYLDLPLLSITRCDRDLCVDLHPSREHLRQSYNMLNYQLLVESRSKKNAKFIQDTRSLDTVVLEGLAPGRQYCVSVRFSDSMEGRMSNFSGDVCDFTSGVYSEDAVISSVLCLLVMITVVVMALLVFTRFICLRRRPLPSALRSIHHIDEVLVVAPHPLSLSLLFCIQPSVPSERKKTFRSSLSDNSDEESATESSGWSSRLGYKQRVGTTDVVSSDCSSLSLSASSILELKPLYSSPDTFSSPSKASISSDMYSRAGQILTLSSDTECLTGGRTREEEEIAMEGHSHNVNLLTLRFAKFEEKTKTSCFSLAEDVCFTEEDTTPPALPSQIGVSTSTDEEERDEPETDLGYMSRPQTQQLCL